MLDHGSAECSVGESTALGAARTYRDRRGEVHDIGR